MGKQQTNNCGRNIFTFGFLYAALVLMGGCQKTDVNFGSQFVDNNYTQIIKIDTVSTLLETRFYDSIQTNGSGVGLVGICKDPLFGTVRASSYLKLEQPQYHNDSDYTRVQYDSLVIILRPNGRYYGDTAKPLHLNVFRLSANVQPKYNNSYYYNFDTIAKYPTPLGQGDYLYYPHNPNTDSIVVRLDDDFGKELLGLLQTKDIRIQNSTSFTNFFEGICISGGTNPSAIIGFSDSVVMRLYYQNPGVITTQRYKDFSFTDASNQFNNISIDRSSTALGTVTPNIRSLVPSSSTGNASYLQAVTGTSVKVSFPYLRSVLQIPNLVKVSRAVLILRPVAGSYSRSFPLPDSLRLTQTDLYNNSLGDISVSNGGTQTALIGTLNVDYLYGQNTGYTFDITSYVNALLDVSQNNAYGVLVSPPQPLFSTRFNRVVFDNGTNPKLSSQLLVYYITVQ